MEKNKIVAIISLMALFLMISGCKKIKSEDNPNDLTTSTSTTSVITAAPTISLTIELSSSPEISPTTVPTVTPLILPSRTPEELSMEAYEKFMKNEAKISFDHFMPSGYYEGSLYIEGREYTLSEVLDIVTSYYFQMFANKKVDFIDYSYIDCGKDGVNELVLRFNGMDFYGPDDDSTLVYIIKYIGGKLSLCYSYETWARCDASINEYGYYKSSGSNGASNHGTEYGFIDKDGNWHSIVYMESEADISRMGQISEVAEKKGITDGIELGTIYFDYDANLDNSDEAGNKESLYTFYAYDDNWEPIEDTNLYTNSIYKEIFDEAKVPFITPDEVSTIISEKESKLGATAEIKEGAEIAWKTLNVNMFTAYVGR